MRIERSAFNSHVQPRSLMHALRGVNPWWIIAGIEAAMRGSDRTLRNEHCFVLGMAQRCYPYGTSPRCRADPGLKHIRCIDHSDSLARVELQATGSATCLRRDAGFNPPANPSPPRHAPKQPKTAHRNPATAGEANPVQPSVNASLRPLTERPCHGRSYSLLAQSYWCPRRYCSFLLQTILVAFPKERSRNARDSGAHATTRKR